MVNSKIWLRLLLLCIKFCKGYGVLECVLDLTPVPRRPVAFRDSLVVRFRIVQDNSTVNAEVFLVFDWSLKFHFPTLHGRFLIQGRMVESDVENRAGWQRQRVVAEPCLPNS